MASIISAGTTTGTALNVSADTSGNLAFQTQAGANTQTLPNGTGTIALTSQLVGVDQTVTNVGASRALATNYTNSTGKPIMVYVSMSNASASAITVSYINGVLLYGSADPSANAYYSVVLLVPSGMTYNVGMNGTPTLVNWVEIR
jgi:hypothetical protein